MKKLFTLFAITLALLCLFSCAAYAAREPINDDGDTTEFLLSQDETTLTYGDITYKLFRGYPPLMIMPDEMYVYEQQLSCKSLGSGDALIMRNLFSRDIIILEGPTGTRLYVTDAGKAVMQRFASRDFPAYTTYTYPQRASVSTEFVTFMDASQNDQQLQRVNVTSLQNVETHIIYGMDETGTFGHEHGAIYVLNGEYWYINYDALDNSHFDSDGYFSYRSGTVTMKKADTAAFEAILAARTEFHIQYTYQSDAPTPIDEDGARIIFSLLTILFLTLPVAALAFSLVLYLREKKPRRLRYLITTILAAAWLTLWLILLIIVLLG